jgi:hypothetical protein
VAFRFRLLDVEGNDLGPLVSQQSHWSVGERVHRGSDEWIVSAVVPSEDAMDSMAYLVVEPAPPSVA